MEERMEKELIYQLAIQEGAYCYAPPSLPEDLELLPKEELEKIKKDALALIKGEMTIDHLIEVNCIE